jgi:ATP-dependent DNA ligase
MTKVYDILKEIKATSKKNEKLAILKKNKDNELLKQVIYHALNPHYRYYMTEKTIPEDYSMINPQITLGEAIEDLYKLHERKITGHAAIEYVHGQMLGLTREDANVYYDVILKDLKSGFSAKTANKVFGKNFIPTIPYMRCSSDDKHLAKIKYPAICQEKMDGAFCNIVVHDKEVDFITRNGTVFAVNNIVNSVLGMTEEQVLIGEMLYLVDGKIAERKVGNGKINKLIKSEQTRESIAKKYQEATTIRQREKLDEKIAALNLDLYHIDTNIVMKVWDMIPYEDWINGEYNMAYEDRFEKVKELCKHWMNNGSILPVESQDVQDEEEFRKTTRAYIKEGKEGSVLKNKTSFFKDGTCREQIKGKAKRDTDLRCIGWEKGKSGSTFENGIGSLILESSDKKLKVNVGTGFARSQRGLEPIDTNNIAKGLQAIEDFDFDQYTGKIIEVEYNELIETKSNRETYSLFLPVFVEVRNDKDEADGLTKIQEDN